MIKIFGSTSCFSCKCLLKELKNKLGDNTSIIEYINIDDNPDSAIKYRIQKLPTTIVNEDIRFVGFSKKIVEDICLIKTN